MSTSSYIQRTILAVIALASIAAAVSLQFAETSPIDWRTAPTSHLLLLVGLQLLPLITLAAITLERRRAR